MITVPSDPLDEILEAAGIPAGVRVPPPPTAEALAMTIEQVVSAFRISFNDAAEVVGQVIDSFQAWLRSLPNEEARVRGIIATQRRRRHRRGR